MKNILFFGPISPPVTGQSVCFETFYQYSFSFCNPILINTNLEGSGSTVKALKTFLSLLKLFMKVMVLLALLF